MPGRHEPPPLDGFLTWRLHRVNKLTDKASGDAYAERFGLGVGEARCLAAIGSFAPLSVNELAAYANLDKGQASRASQSLVDRGFVSKRPSDADARAVVLETTAAGRRLWQGIMGLISERNAQIFGCLSRTEQRQLAGMLDRVLAHAQG
jgi:DNA-binding MarR family transcriptional regulator